jgi:hypothetical protein
MTEPILYLTQCPVCEQGLVRLRTISHQSRLHCICQCDECDASWFSPLLNERLPRVDVDRMISECEKSYWSSMEEICLFGWAGFIRPSQSSIVKHSD